METSYEDYSKKTMKELEVIRKRWENYAGFNLKELRNIASVRHLSRIERSAMTGLEKVEAELKRREHGNIL
jgi:hypothetical protein